MKSLRRLYARSLSNSKNRNSTQGKSNFRTRARIFEKLEELAMLSVDPIGNALATDVDQPSEFHALFAPGTSADVVEAFHDFIGDPGSDAASGFDAYQTATRWGNTASDGSGLSWGDATTITWSIAPDGTNIPGFNGEAAAASNFVAFMGGIYGSSGGGVENQPWFSIVESVFDRWSDVSGINFVYETNDDGAAYSNFSGTAPGVSGVRGDIRVGGHRIDGNSGVLAYNFYPNNGEMVIDTADSFYSNTGSNSIRLRNVMAHEVGHGIGLAHVDPSNGTKLLEPYANTSFDGPQHDDILAVHRLYGDENEFGAGNDTGSNATSLGALSDGSFSLGDNNVEQYVSIDSASDVDYFTFTASAGTELDLTLLPLGFTYTQGAQGGSTSSFNSKAQNDLKLEVLSSNFSVIASADNAGLSGNEALASVSLDAGGTYYLRVTGDRDAAQLYQLDVSVTEGGGGTPPPPPPAPSDAINFNDYSIDSYGGGQDFSGTSNVEGGGSTLHLTGNRWKKIDFPYTITPDTVIEFDFSSTSQGEIHGIGFDTDTAITSSRTFQVYGTQNWGILDFDNYSGSGTTHYVIPVGQYYTGNVINLFFTNDHDVSSPSAVSLFNNVKVYEDDGDGTPGPAAPTAAADSFDVSEDASAQSFNVLANDSDGGGGAVSVTGVSAGSAGGSISVVGGQTISYRPTANFFGTETFTYTIANGAGQSTATVTVDVAEVNDLPTATDDSYTVDGNSQSNLLNVRTNDTTNPDQGETLTITGVGTGSAGGTIGHNGQQIIYTPAQGFVGTETFLYTVNDGTPGSNATATVSVEVTAPAPAPNTINFNDYSVDPYGGRQDYTGTSTIEDGGSTLHLTGNRWKKIDLPYTITANTVIEFDFSSTSQGEIHGIGFDTNANISSNRTFRVYGTQNWGIGDYDNYSGSGTAHYVIPVGQHYTGSVINMFFTNDHDVSSPSAVSVFSNVRIYEANPISTSLATAAPEQSSASGRLADQIEAGQQDVWHDRHVRLQPSLRLAAARSARATGSDVVQTLSDYDFRSTRRALEQLYATRSPRKSDSDLFDVDRLGNRAADWMLALDQLFADFGR